MAETETDSLRFVRGTLEHGDPYVGGQALLSPSSFKMTRSGRIRFLNAGTQIDVST